MRIHRSIKKISTHTTGLAIVFFTPAIIEDLLISFCMFNAEAHDLGLSPDI
jgi:hypothetical protein